MDIRLKFGETEEKRMMRVERTSDHQTLIASYNGNEMFRMSKEIDGKWRVVSSDLIGSDVPTVKVLIKLAQDCLNYIEANP